MGHEKTVDFDVTDKKGRTRHILTPSVGKNKGKVLATASSRNAITNFAKARSAEGHNPKMLNPSASAFSRPSGARVTREDAIRLGIGKHKQ